MLLAVAIAWFVRLYGSGSQGTWSHRWQTTLGLFLFSPLLLLITAIAVLSMGSQGHMLGLSVGWIGYLLALSFLGTGAVLLVWLGGQGWRSIQHLQSYPLVNRAGTAGRLLDTSIPYAAQIGFWQPTLVMSEGLLTTLQPDQLEAVLVHEQAHRYYRDTFWFFWLGWLRQLTVWLPHTEALWQELLLLRELRADRWAAQRVDPLLLAESLILMVKAPLVDVGHPCAAFNPVTPISRLEERIEALVEEPPTVESNLTGVARWMVLSLLPLLTIIFHT
jgi:Zn-dependent protease with chaperone function